MSPTTPRTRPGGSVDDLARGLMGRYLRGKRESLGMSLRELAGKAGLGGTMASYIAQLERGAKVPSDRVAYALAMALRDDPQIYRAWAALGRRSSWEATAWALQALARTLGDPVLREEMQALARRGGEGFEAARMLRERIAPVMAEEESHMPLRVRSPLDDLRARMSRSLDQASPEQREALAWVLSKDSAAEGMPVEMLARLGWAPAVAQAASASEPPADPEAAREMDTLKRLGTELRSAGIEPHEMVRALEEDRRAPQVRRITARPREARAGAPNVFRMLFDSLRPARPGWVVIPEYAEGADPDHGAQPVGSRKMNPEELAGLRGLSRPITWRLSEAGVRRLTDVLEPGRFVVVSRPLHAYAAGLPCAVRVGGGLLLARVLWNGRQLLLLPAPGQGDFVTLDAPDDGALERLVAGRVVGMVVSGWD